MNSSTLLESNFFILLKGRQELDCILHIGHGKTGTSFIQSKLAQSSQLLMQHGYTYPYHKSQRKASLGQVSSGNGDLILDLDYKISCSSIFSNEGLFRSLANHDAIASLITRLHQEGSGLKIVIYTRDLFDHSVSAWGQSIKRGRKTLSYNDFMLKRYGNHFSILKYWLTAAQNLDMNLAIYNYSRHKSDLWTHFKSNALQIKDMTPIDDIDQNFRVNRSLTTAEYELQRLFNDSYPLASRRFISDPLVNNLPNIPSEKPYMSKDTYNTVLERLEGVLLEVNTKLDDGEEILVESFEALQDKRSKSDFEQHTFSQDQLEVIVNSITDELISYRNSTLINGDADYLRKIADRIERGKNLSLENALQLMQLAKRARPNSTYISNKIDEYKSKL